MPRNLGVGLVNWLATQLLSPQSLPRMDFEHGIPPEHRTLVAVPTMLTSAAGIEHLLEGWKCGTWRIATRACTLPC